MRIYIAGRMTGIPEHNYPAFAQAAAAWRNAGWAVLNPAEHFGGDQTRSYYEYIVDLKTCDAIAMLPGWNDEEARGSVWEQLIAKHILTIPIYDATQPVAPNPDADPRAGEILPVDYEEYRAFQAWRILHANVHKAFFATHG